MKLLRLEYWNNNDRILWKGVSRLLFGDSWYGYDSDLIKMIDETNIDVGLIDGSICNKVIVESIDDVTYQSTSIAIISRQVAYEHHVFHLLDRHNWLSDIKGQDIGEYVVNSWKSIIVANEKSAPIVGGSHDLFDGIDIL